MTSNYILIHGNSYNSDNKGWNNAMRVMVASAVNNSYMTVKQAAEMAGCCESSVRNWVATLDVNNPQMQKWCLSKNPLIP